MPGTLVMKNRSVRPAPWPMGYGDMGLPCAYWTCDRLFGQQVLPGCHLFCSLTKSNLNIQNPKLISIQISKRYCTLHQLYLLHSPKRINKNKYRQKKRMRRWHSPIRLSDCLAYEWYYSVPVKCRVIQVYIGDLCVFLGGFRRDGWQRTQEVLASCSRPRIPPGDALLGEQMSSAMAWSSAWRWREQECQG